MTELLGSLLCLVIGVCAGLAWMAVYAPEAIRELRTEVATLRAANATLTNEREILRRATIDAVHQAAEFEELRVCSAADAENARRLLARELVRNGTPPALPAYTYTRPVQGARNLT